MFFTEPEPRQGVAGLMAQGIGQPLGGLLGQETQRAITSRRLQGLLDSGIKEKAPLEQMISLYSALPQTPATAQLLGDIGPLLMRQQASKGLKGFLEGGEQPAPQQPAPQQQRGYDELFTTTAPQGQPPETQTPFSQESNFAQQIDAPTPFSNLRQRQRTNTKVQPSDFLNDIGQIDPQVLANAPVDPVLRYAAEAGLPIDQIGSLYQQVQQGRMAPIELQQKLYELAKDKALTVRGLTDSDRQLIDNELERMGFREDETYYRNLAQEEYALSDAPNSTARLAQVNRKLSQLRNSDVRYRDVMSKPMVRGDYNQTFNKGADLMKDYKKQTPFVDKLAHEHMMTMAMQSNWEPYEATAQINPQGKWMGKVGGLVKDFPVAKPPNEPGGTPTFALTPEQEQQKQEMWEKVRPKIARLWAENANDTDSPLVLRKLLNSAAGIDDEMFRQLWDDIAMIRNPSVFQESDAQHLYRSVRPSLWEVLKGKRSLTSPFRQYKFDEKLLLRG